MSDPYTAALALLRRCTTDDGIVASPTDERNYRRVWARDSVMCGLAGLAAGDDEITEGLRNTLDLLVTAQGPEGQIPSNVSMRDGRIVGVSYGGLAGRVDTIPWFVIGLSHYVHATGDEAFGEKHALAAREALQLLAAWEFNARSLVYVPMGGDWADEYVLHGYVFFDQVLRLWANRCFAQVIDTEPLYPGVSDRIESTYAPSPTGDPEAAYHGTAYRRFAEEHGEARYWLAALSPSGYQTQFDAFGNALAVLLDLGTAAHRERVLDTGEEVRSHRPGRLVPAFWPPIEPGDRQWAALTDNYRDTFSNRPGHYHNGGLWPMVNGWWGLALAHAGRTDPARDVLDALDAANRTGDASDDDPSDETTDDDTSPYGFPEYRDAINGAPHGITPLGWSAATYVLLTHALENGSGLLFG
jgi:hypothetical protein